MHYSRGYLGQLMGLIAATDLSVSLAPIPLLDDLHYYRQYKGLIMDLYSYSPLR